jgi:hypothetical protein
MEGGGKFVWTQGEEHGTRNPYPCPGKLAERIKAEFINWHEALIADIETLGELHSYEEPELYIDYDGRRTVAY